MFSKIKLLIIDCSTFLFYFLNILVETISFQLLKLIKIRDYVLFYIITY